MVNIKEPDFEGEVMKIPTTMQSSESDTQLTAQNTLNTPIIVVLTLILVAIFGGLAYWYYLVTTMSVAPASSTRPTPEMNQEPETPTSVARTEATDVVSTSDELAAIEADIESTNIDDLDMEMNAIEAELNAALEASI